MNNIQPTPVPAGPPWNMNQLQRYCERTNKVVGRRAEKYEKALTLIE